MATTHALVGMALALPVAYAAPEFAPIALLSGLIGGFFPDLDMYVGHRKTLHYPVYYPVAAAIAVITAVFAPAQATIGLAVCLLAASAHSIMDVFGGGLELRPWLGTADRAVYDHHRRRWIAPKQWVRYDGAPEDLLLAVVLAAVLWPAAGEWESARTLIVGLVGISAVYATVRKQLVRVRERIVPRLPEPIRARCFGVDDEN